MIGSIISTAFPLEHIIPTYLNSSFSLYFYLKILWHFYFYFLFYLLFSSHLLHNDDKCFACLLCCCCFFVVVVFRGILHCTYEKYGAALLDVYAIFVCPKNGMTASVWDFDHAHRHDAESYACTRVLHSITINSVWF